MKNRAHIGGIREGNCNTCMVSKNPTPGRHQHTQGKVRNHQQDSKKRKELEQQHRESRQHQKECNANTQQTPATTMGSTGYPHNREGNTWHSPTTKQKKEKIKAKSGKRLTSDGKRGRVWIHHPQSLCRQHAAKRCVAGGWRLDPELHQKAAGRNLGTILCWIVLFDPSMGTQKPAPGNGRTGQEVLETLDSSSIEQDSVDAWGLDHPPNILGVQLVVQHPACNLAPLVELE